VRVRSTPPRSDITTAESSYVTEAVAKAPPTILRKQIPRVLFITAVAIGIGLRIWVSTFGYNFDFESYAVVASIIDSGGNVYAETHRYNYGETSVCACYSNAEAATVSRCSSFSTLFRSSLPVTTGSSVISRCCWAWWRQICSIVVRPIGWTGGNGWEWRCSPYR